MVARALPPGGLLVVGASSPIRDLDLMVPRYQVGARRKVVANRGLSGIDGTVSTAIGAALARPDSTRALALMGDVTFLHDANGLILGPAEPVPDLTHRGGQRRRRCDLLDAGAGRPVVRRPLRHPLRHPARRRPGRRCARRPARPTGGSTRPPSSSTRWPAPTAASRWSRWSSGATTAATWTPGSGRSPRGDRQPAQPLIGETRQVEIALLLVRTGRRRARRDGPGRRIDIPAPFLLIVAGSRRRTSRRCRRSTSHEDVVLFGLLPPLLYAAAQQTSLVDFNANRRPILLLSIGLVALHDRRGRARHPRDAARHLVGARAGDRCRRRTARRRRRDRDRAPDRAAAPDRDDPRGRVAAQRRDRAGGAADRARRGRRQRRRRLGRSASTSWSPPVAACWSASRSSSSSPGCASGSPIPVIDSAISLVVPFAAYVVAEEIHASGVLAVVIAGLLLGHKAPLLQTAQSRIAERLNWRTIAFVLENTVFLLIGLQAWWIIQGAEDSELGCRRIAAVCGATLLAVIVLRMVWVFPTRYLLVRPGRTRSPGTSRRGPTPSSLGWAGMRGVVTLAAAFVIPEDTEHREVLLLMAFTVVAGTLLHPGPDPADGGAPAEGALARPGRGRPRPRDPAPAGVQGGAGGARDPRVRRRPRRHRPDPAATRPAQLRRLGAARRPSTDKEAPSDLYARSGWRCSRPSDGGCSRSAAPARCPPRWSPTCWRCSTSRSRCSTTRPRSARTCAPRPCCAAPARRATTSRRYPAVGSSGPTCVCERCIEDGTHWVALRQCLECGIVGCCDSSAQPARHRALPRGAAPRHAVRRAR